MYVCVIVFVFVFAVVFIQPDKPEDLYSICVWTDIVLTFVLLTKEWNDIL
jgi:L-asparagine transporter-like permease